jgi:hypothetical protein
MPHRSTKIPWKTRASWVRCHAVEAGTLGLMVCVSAGCATLAIGVGDHYIGGSQSVGRRMGAGYPIIRAVIYCTLGISGRSRVRAELLHFVVVPSRRPHPVQLYCQLADLSHFRDLAPAPQDQVIETGLRGDNAARAVPAIFLFSAGGSFEFLWPFTERRLRRLRWLQHCCRSHSRLRSL